MTFFRNRGWPLAFNFLFWTPFWLFPLAGVLLRPAMRYSVPLFASHILGGVLVSAGLAGLADLSGRSRRWFYLAAGFLCWIGAQVWILFLFSSTDTISTFTIATVGQYFHGDGAETSYVYISPWCALPMASATLPLLALWRYWRQLNWAPSVPHAALGLMLAAALLPLDLLNRYHQGMGDDGHGMTPLYRIDLFTPGDSYYQFYRYLDQLAELRRYQTQKPLAARSHAEPLTLIVLVGESTARPRMSIYGYCRATTPQLDALLPELGVFDNLISNFPLTLFALRNLFRLPSVPTASGPEPSTLFNVLAAAGFRTAWISSQYKYGGPADVLTTLMSATQSQIWARHLQQKSHTYTDDTVLLPWIEKTLDNPDPHQAAFFHMMGSHFTYSSRYPPDFARRWKPLASARSDSQRAIIDSYDTAVRYQDQVIAQAIRLAEARGEKRNIALVYFSDHGEETFEQYPIVLHAYPNATRRMVEVPLLVWLSPALRKTRPDLARAVEAARHRPLQTADVAPLILDLASVKTEGDTLTHPLLPGFREGKRMVSVYDYDRDPDLGRTPMLPPLCR